jgi:hypothetical protein
MKPSTVAWYDPVVIISAPAKEYSNFWLIIHSYLRKMVLDIPLCIINL